MNILIVLLLIISVVLGEEYEGGMGEAEKLRIQIEFLNQKLKELESKEDYREKLARLCFKLKVINEEVGTNWEVVDPEECILFYRIGSPSYSVSIPEFKVIGRADVERHAFYLQIYGRIIAFLLGAIGVISLSAGIGKTIMSEGFSLKVILQGLFLISIMVILAMLL